MKDRCPYATEDRDRAGRRGLFCEVVHGCIPAAGDYDVSSDRCPHHADISVCHVYKTLQSGELSDEFVQYLNKQDGFYLLRAVVVPNNLPEERRETIEQKAIEHGFRVGKCLPNEFADYYLTVSQSERIGGVKSANQ